tara:strand:+ start:2964 stop:4070 length:1107 start_codon:yes stop_codon:yes gene_type:complete
MSILIIPPEEIESSDESEKGESVELLNLSFSGGGFKGASFLGCVRALEEYGLLKNIKCVAGSSAGALAATLIACKANFSYMKECTMKIMEHFEKYKFSWYSIVQNAQTFSNEYGIHKTEELRKLFLNFIMKATGSTEDLTFKQLYDLTNIKLIITATCLDSRTPFYFNYETTPHTEVSEALVISVSIPLLFASQKFDNRTMVDGCIIEHIPMQCWGDDEIKNTMAFLVKSRNEVYHLRANDIDNIYDYVEKLIQSLRKQSDEWYYNKYKDTIVLIVTQLSAYLKHPTKDELATTIYSSYFQTLKALSDKKFISDVNLPTSGMISSFIISDEMEEEDIHIQHPVVERKFVNTTYGVIAILLIILVLKNT